MIFLLVLLENDKEIIQKSLTRLNNYHNESYLKLHQSKDI